MNLNQELDRQWKIASVLIKTSWKSASAYRWSMMLSVLIDPILLLANVVIWKAVYAANGTKEIAGYSLPEMITYFLVSYLLTHLVWDWVEEEMSEMVRKGEFTKYLMRPYPFYSWFLCNKIGERMLAVIVEIIPICLIAGLFFDLNLGSYVPNLGWFALSVLISFVFFYSIRFAVGTLAFWLNSTNGIRRLATFFVYFMSGGLFPLTLLPEWLQKVFFWLPFQYVEYVPLQAFLGRYSLAGMTFPIWQVVLIQGAYCIAFTLLALLFWKISMKRYSGVGA